MGKNGRITDRCRAILALVTAIAAVLLAGCAASNLGSAPQVGGDTPASAAPQPVVQADAGPDEPTVGPSEAAAPRSRNPTPSLLPREGFYVIDEPLLCGGKNLPEVDAESVKPDWCTSRDPAPAAAVESLTPLLGRHERRTWSTALGEDDEWEDVKVVDILQLRERDDGVIVHDGTINFANYHTCDIGGEVDALSPGRYVFRVGPVDHPDTCRILVEVDRKTFHFRDDCPLGCMHTLYCGTRGGMRGIDMPRSRKPGPWEARQ